LHNIKNFSLNYNHLWFHSRVQYRESSVQSSTRFTSIHRWLYEFVVAIDLMSYIFANKVFEIFSNFKLNKRHNSQFSRNSLLILWFAYNIHLYIAHIFIINICWLINSEFSSYLLKMHFILNLRKSESFNSLIQGINL
jgi:hypothetical protein